MVMMMITSTGAGSRGCPGSKMSSPACPGRSPLRENEKIIQKLTAFLPVENVPDHGDVAAVKVDVHLGTFVLAFRSSAHYGPGS